MFQYASIYSVGRINGLRLVMSSSFNLRNIFANLVESTNSFRPCLYYTKLFERDPYQFESAITSLPNDTDYLVEGFLQSWRYFEPFKTEIHRQFTFKKHVANMAKFSLETALDSFRRTRNPTIPIRTYVGIHVRRGDYAKLLLSRSVGINLPTSTYFHTAKNYFRSLYPSPVFVVCSDDIAWCENNIGTDDAVFIRGNTPEVDLAILASLNHTITSFGTFTFWAAWLANGTTVYPKTIVDENFGDRRDIYLRDHVYPTWIPL
ncbi:hypothetical protein SNE40_020091 [Patella caerulea]|uniref:L-Fucosyltransferase n=1 Tax=Patella caerulea TaxID=87958 RepID=A0AAN8GDS0_PATCE